MACSLDPHIHISLGCKVDSLYPNGTNINSKQNFKAPSNTVKTKRVTFEIQFIL